ncbi:hypothetical protein SAMN04488003_101428 [Loktanella fryxellensis]|uniref:Uncharacterized protein n=1 Tax=Loktanella fryxellensis TaxID=245187 RepID=A0A1H7Z3G7_9RHOB|nr:hypothetical protein [Loktanella fryxellensis]SEM52805.1 hypothetical protein SAMN04488003_101428 [Loktanella fryxellensis]
MKATFARLHPSTPGERRMLAAMLVLAACGGVLCLMVATQMGEVKTLRRSLTAADAWFCVAGSLGALAGFRAGRGWLGHAGVGGAVRAACGALIVSFVGALVAGTLALPFYGTMFGPLMFALTLLGHPVLAAVWLAVLGTSHRMMRDWRRERDSLFRPLDLQDPPLSPLRQGNWLAPAWGRTRR